MKKTKIKIILKYTLTSFILLSTPSCKKFLELPAPTTSLNAQNVYKYDNTAAAVLTGLYAQMMGEFTTGGITSVSLLTELSSDNLVLFDLNNQMYLQYYQNNLDPSYQSSGDLGILFNNFYSKIFTINAAIEGLLGSSTLTPSIKTRLLGESYFLRSFYYFYLVNLYGDVPLALSTDYSLNAGLSRAPADDIYKQIISDLSQARKLLTDTYLDGGASKPTTERVRPNLSAATALLSRVNLFIGKYSEADKTATEVISKSALYELLPLNEVFLKNSKETIWSLQPVKNTYNTDEAVVFLLTSPPSINGKIFYASDQFISNFEAGDMRLSNWTGSIMDGSKNYQFIAKYKADVNSGAVTEYNIVLRLSEQYLIRAEARAHLNNIQGSKDDLNLVRRRAGLPPTQYSTQEDLLNAIQHERRSELFTEWGHRWLDIKRNKNIDEIMKTAEQYKNGNWASYKALYPIPNSELQRNKNLTQNIGYAN